MKKSIPVTTLFVDIGGVLLTDGWSHEFRKLAVNKFNLNMEEMEIRHSMTFETFEIGWFVDAIFTKKNKCRKGIFLPAVIAA